MHSRTARHTDRPSRANREERNRNQDEPSRLKRRRVRTGKPRSASFCVGSIPRSLRFVEGFREKFFKKCKIRGVPGDGFPASAGAERASPGTRCYDSGGRLSRVRRRKADRSFSLFFLLSFPSPRFSRVHRCEADRQNDGFSSFSQKRVDRNGIFC